MQMHTYIFWPYDMCHIYVYTRWYIYIYVYVYIYIYAYVHARCILICVQDMYMYTVCIRIREYTPHRDHIYPHHHPQNGFNQPKARRHHWRLREAF